MTWQPTSPRVGGTRHRAPRRRHVWRWIIAGLVTLVLIVVGGFAASVKLQRALAPLTLPTSVRPPAGTTDGTWDVSAGSVAGFRVRETALGLSNDTVGRTSAVTGTVVITGNEVTTARFQIGLTTVKVGAKTQPQFATSLDTRQYPTATFVLARPATLASAFASGSTITAEAFGQLTMHGIARSVAFPVSGRRAGPAIDVTGSIPVTFAAWGIKGPAGYGFIGSLADHGVAEFLLIMRRP